MAHHQSQRDLINNDDAADRLKLPVHAPPPPSAPATAAMPSPLALPPPAVAACSSSGPAVSPRNPNADDGPFKLPPPDQAPLPAPAAVDTAALQSSSAAAAAVTAPAAAAAPARCSSCRKRLGLAGFRCRCGSLFCGVHRYSDRHACTFDYKAQAREAIARDNPAYKAPKLLKI